MLYTEIQAGTMMLIIKQDHIRWSDSDSFVSVGDACLFSHSRHCSVVYSQSLLSSFFLLLQNPVLAELCTLLVSPSLPGEKKKKQVYRITFRKKNRKTFMSTTTTHTKPGLQNNL